jgi:hypothetical protein
LRRSISIIDRKRRKEKEKKREKLLETEPEVSLVNSGCEFGPGLGLVGLRRPVLHLVHVEALEVGARHRLTAELGLVLVVGVGRLERFGRSVLRLVHVEARKVGLGHRHSLWVWDGDG